LHPPAAEHIQTPKAVRPTPSLELANHSVIASAKRPGARSSAQAAKEVILRRAEQMFRTQQIDPPVLLLIEMLPARSAEMSSDDGAPASGSKAISTTRHDAAKYQRFFNTIHEHFCASGVQCPVGGKGDLSTSRQHGLIVVAALERGAQNLETHSLTHVHKHVSAELVEHAPSGAPEQLICCVVTDEAWPRHYGAL
jgi:hypothetical protein